MNSPLNSRVKSHYRQRIWHSRAEHGLPEHRSIDLRNLFRQYRLDRSCHQLLAVSPEVVSVLSDTVISCASGVGLVINKAALEVKHHM